jgi:hypothetical protein
MALMRALERAFHDHRGALPPPIRYLVQSGRRRRQSQSLDRGGAHRLPCWRRGHDQCLASSDRPGWPLIDSPSACVAATLASLICPFVDLCFDFISPGSDIGPHLGPICSRSIGGFPSSLLGRPSPLDSRRLCQLRGARITTRSAGGRILLAVQPGESYWSGRCGLSITPQRSR